LKEVKRSLLGSFKPKIELQGAKRLINGDIKTLKTNLMNNEDTVIVPTDKTSSYRTVPTTTYCNWVETILKSVARIITKEQVGEIYMKCTDRLDELMSHLTSNESNFIRETLETKSIPTPTLLIKDHKPLEEDGNFPRRIIIPATNFTAGFPKVGYQGIRKNTYIQQHKFRTIYHRAIKSPPERTAGATSIQRRHHLHILRRCEHVSFSEVSQKLCHLKYYFGNEGKIRFPSIK
jgi:hypothetical protein